ncbi:receptor-type tyrosine-protein phosphatase mu [Trichonephila inaurata madagascariensis]|uniref:Receptor-type tyrosine-protein phosphatase mu n=1 Tax=Trichonephila inaurata madagascariensis TaxID=2747483 RepID=A0A8X6X337_9ARAC|nr:receptor-type tyrosine-protein phosphatase mu [Trichonephila inaurata madagascariensis]
MVRKETLLLSVCLLAGVCWADIDAVIEPPPPSRELNVEKLDYYVNTDEGKAILFSEFLSIKGGKRKPWTEAEKPENLPKNRYDDLLAYDETRVKLEPRSYDESDYINANYIDGYHRQKEYVATQGPLPNTTRDFWSMVWQLNIKKVLMLANLLEHGKPKVAKYWPEDSDTYGDIIVTKLYENAMPEIKHVIRIFSIKKENVIPFNENQPFSFTGAVRICPPGCERLVQKPHNHPGVSENSGPTAQRRGRQDNNDYIGSDRKRISGSQLKICLFQSLRCIYL